MRYMVLSFVIAFVASTSVAAVSQIECQAGIGAKLIFSETSSSGVPLLQFSLRAFEMNLSDKQISVVREIHGGGKMVKGTGDVGQIFIYFPEFTRSVQSGDVIDLRRYAVANIELRLNSGKNRHFKMDCLEADVVY